MTTTPPPVSDRPRVTADDLRDLSRLHRSTSDRKVAGVCGGLARFFDVDPTVVRVLMVVAGFFGGGIILYGAGWLLLPLDNDERAMIHLEPNVRLLVLIAATVMAIGSMFGGLWGREWGFPWPVLGVALAIGLYFALRERSVGGARPAVDLTKEQSGESWTAQQAANGWPSAPIDWSPGPQPVPAQQRRTPSLFAPTLALVALGVGVLLLVEISGVSVPDAGYAALALAISGAMLVLGSVFGRAGFGVYLVGIIAAIGLTSSGLTNLVGATHETPRTAATVKSTYTLAAGSLDLDLSEVGDVAALAGRTVKVDGAVGQITVTVPAGVDVRVDAEVTNNGEVEVFGQTDSRDNPRVVRTLDRGLSAPELTIDADLEFGQIVVKEAS